MSVNSVMKTLVAVSLLTFTVSCEDEPDFQETTGSGDNTEEVIPGGTEDNGKTDDNATTPEDSTAITEKPTPGQKIDLGLSVKWAGWNMGASTPDEFGEYYAWGETSAKSDYTWSNYEHWTDSNGDGYCAPEEVYYIGDNIGGTRYDVAHAKWGGSWRMPTRDEMQELVDKCTWEWGVYNGVNGQYVTGPNGNSIFLPAMGMYSYGAVVTPEIGIYWTSTDSSDNLACTLCFYNGYSNTGVGNRANGLSIRAVAE